MKEQSLHRLMVSCFLTAIILVAGMTAGCKGKQKEEAAKRPEITGVTVSPVSMSTVDDVYEVTGTVRANNTSIVASRVMGVVTSIPVREGDSVKAGQVILIIDDRDAVQRARAANMAVESAKQSNSLAEKTWQRYKKLYDENVISRQEMDQMDAKKKIADAEYERIKSLAEEARTYMSFARVTAPISGRITEKRIDAGLGGKVKTGMVVEAIVETMDRPLAGMIREVFPSVDPLSRTFTVKVEIRNVSLRSGLFARVRIPVGKREAILAPDRAIVQKGQLTGVYAVDGQGIVTYRLVRKGNASAGGTEILSGLAVNDRIITAGVEKVIDGGVLTGEKTK
jgi:multidrug efflux pump subunit AcrA (membrane-fusion protein)